MKNYFIAPLFSAFLLGCSSSPTTNNTDIFNTITGGQSAGDATSFYWYTERLDLPFSASDYVASGDYGWYKSDYRWRKSIIKEIVREGVQRQASMDLVPYRIHLRFDNTGEAVYQQYRLDGKVLPLRTGQIQMLLNEAESIQVVTKQQDSKGSELIQGYWDGEVFNRCDGNKFEKIEFNQTLPTFVINRLANLDSYAAFVGATPINKIVVNDLLMLEDESFDCVERPILIKDE
ncbi:DUF1481 domain-containing protein [Vibrio algarum]|uniref:DUF1481 domain-containing protein n=1 Tax=Vibrio algarum TaxID=3020714 RepID=A0ABT4YMF3_9VIBR|nr:DUF1481 domain-containing protein [Vibrio sp. KJ40-1]MDB1122727.1 DUF1481 domain-containing protein [Vibrio sp. KJ40-1]